VDSRDQLPVINDQPSSQKQSHQEKEKKKKFLVSGFPKALVTYFSCGFPVHPLRFSVFLLYQTKENGRPVFIFIAPIF
jgi:hypothetical protein